jgi:rhamnose utilization protein RhaD (predicted bifunctional aldolase and dehydrogenase)
MSIEALAEISRYYGANPDYVIAGGGNTSFKDGETLYIKGSGTALADAVPEAFVRMDRKSLAKMWEKSYPAESAAREKEVLADLMASRKAGEENKRPSVETMLHDILPFDFVVHTHPALVNGLTCSQQGEAAAKELFPEAIWIPSINPGYILSLKVKTSLDEYTAKNGKPASIIFLQNHGVFVGAACVDEIKEIYRDIMGRLEKAIKRQPDFAGENDNAPWMYLSAMEAITGGKLTFRYNREISALTKNREAFYPVSSAFTPDHIVYAGSDPVFSEAGSEYEGGSEWNKHIEKTGRPPKIIALRGVGVFGLGTTEKAAGLAMELFIDSIKVAVYSESFGGPLFMSQDKIDFINNWEVEQFRTNVAIK